MGTPRDAGVTSAVPSASPLSMARVAVAKPGDFASLGAVDQAAAVKESKGMSREATLELLHDGSAHVCPSLLNCSFANLAEEIADAERCGARVVHWDVMDAHFVPNFTYGPPVIRSLRPHSSLIFDTHLMMADPGRYLDNFLEAGCDTITIHWEAVPDPTELLAKIRAAGVLAGLAINPPTPVESITPWLDQADIFLMMSVNPGFGHQTFEPDTLDKIRWVREAVPQALIEVDGGVKTENIGAATAAGARMHVVGSAFYEAPDRQAEFDALQESIRGALLA